MLFFQKESTSSPVLTVIGYSFVKADGKNISADKLKDDQSDYIKTQLKTLSSAKSAISRIKKDYITDDKYISGKASGLVIDIEELIDLLRKKFSL